MNMEEEQMLPGKRREFSLEENEDMQILIKNR